MLPSMIAFMSPLFAWQNDDAVAAVASLLVLFVEGVLVLALIGLQIYVAYTHMKILDSIPRQFRLMEPWQAWLLLVPCLNIIWPFFLYAKTPESLQLFAQAKGRNDLGDCGGQLGLWTAIAALCCGPVGVILLVIYTMKIMEASKQLS